MYNSFLYEFPIFRWIEKQRMKRCKVCRGSGSVMVDRTATHGYERPESCVCTYPSESVDLLKRGILIFLSIVGFSIFIFSSIIVTFLLTKYPVIVAFTIFIPYISYIIYRVYKL